MCCLLSQRSCAKFLGVSVRTVGNWDNGDRRVPWSVVRLLRLLRQGDLGSLDDSWDGFKLVRGKLFTPDGRGFRQEDLRRWWLTVEHAQLFLKRYELETRGVGRSPALTLQPEVVQARVLVEALPPPVEADHRLTALLGAFLTHVAQLAPSLPSLNLQHLPLLDLVERRHTHAFGEDASPCGERSEPHGDAPQLLAGLVTSRTSQTGGGQ